MGNYKMTNLIKNISQKFLRNSLNYFLWSHLLTNLKSQKILWIVIEAYTWLDVMLVFNDIVLLLVLWLMIL